MPMHMRFTAILLIVALLLIITFAGPAFAQDMTHSVQYDLDGLINIKKQVGHFCNTGAEMKQIIEGEGSMAKLTDAVLVKGKVTVTDENDWVTAPDAVVNLTVTSAIKLCAPPKMLVDGDQEIQLGNDELMNIEFEGPMGIIARLLGIDSLEVPLGDEVVWTANDGAVVSPYHPAVLAGLLEVEELTRQIWATSVSADPGFAGSLHTSFEAANGPYEDHYQWSDEYPEDWANFMPIERPGGRWGSLYDRLVALLNAGMPLTMEELVLAYSGEDGAEDSWWYNEDGEVVIGDEFVGSYFTIEQYALTTQGTMKRFIDISSPWSHGLFYEDMVVTGYSEVSESLFMDNLKPGEETLATWWELF